MPRYHNINGNNVQFTAEEETARDNEEAAWANAAPARALATLRARRNQLLAETDFWGNSDMTMSDDMTTYRQALRDLPAGKDTVDKCENATWPTKP
tara:strand:+ start:32 stop:319 length:288 start_codon:yes stop_codon:yes gene_type:complete